MPVILLNVSLHLHLNLEIQIQIMIICEMRGRAVCATLALFVLFLLYTISGPETFQLYADNLFVAKSVVENWAPLVPFTCTCKYRYEPWNF